MNSHLLIYAPERQSPMQRSLYGTITFVAWAVYLYLILPLLTLLLWAAGLRNSYVELWLPEGGFDPTLAITLPLLALCCAVVLIGWAEFNRRKFQNNERRLQIDNATQVDIASELRVEPSMAVDLHNARIATLSMDDKATLKGVLSTSRLEVTAAGERSTPAPQPSLTA